MSKKSNRFSPEVRERAVRLVDLPRYHGHIWTLGFRPWLFQDFR
jgi:hypothetical protein